MTSTNEILTEIEVPINTRVKVLPPRDEFTGKIIAEAAVQIAGRMGTVIPPSVRGKISVQLDVGGVFHLDPDRVAVLLKRVGAGK